MSDEQNFENEGGAVAPPEPVAPEAPAWTPSREDFEALQESNKQLQAKLAEHDSYFQPPEDDGMPDMSEIDLSDPYTMAALIDRVVDQRLQSVTPYVKTAAQEQGKKQMETMFGELEAEVGSFDHDLAERTAFYFYDQSGDAEKSVREAAKYAAEVRKRERDEATSEIRSRATRRGSGSSEDFGATTSAVPGETPAKSYDEVIDKYVHQNEL